MPASLDSQPTPDPAPLSQQSLVEIPLDQRSTVAPPGAPRDKTPEQLVLERQLSGVVLSSAVLEHSSGHEADMAVTPNLAGPAAFGERHSGDELGGMLQPTITLAARARMLPARRLLLPKGAFVDCTLETAIDSSLPGMTTCVTATDTFGADGNVVLMERGTKLIGETSGQVAQGGSRIFVLWTEARTPAGVVVPLDSPAADELGRSGLSGEINRHFWQRFGAAMLVSVIDGAVEAASQSSRPGGAVIINPSSSQNVLTDILKGTVNIPPTLVKRNGDRIQVLVARDLDFRSVYELRPMASGR
jgi:type IV secretion system protein VirB10